MAGSAPFRDFFRIPHKDVLNWFPGHMGRGMRIMQQKLRSVDGIIEVHDARIPLSGRNSLFRQKISLVRPHLLLLNKSDLADLSKKDEIVECLKLQGVSQVLFTDCRSGNKDLHQVIPTMVDLMKTNLASGGAPPSSKGFHLMVIGVPNVGKSTFINFVRQKYTKRAGNAPVGSMPGITRAVQNVITVSERPKVFVIDTPGIAHPEYKDVHGAMRLALCHVMHDDKVGVENIVDYLLFWMNKNYDVRYVHHFGLKETVDDVTAFVAEYASLNDLYLAPTPSADGSSTQKPDLRLAATRILQEFRTGKIGKFMLDHDRLMSKDEIRSRQRH